MIDWTINIGHILTFVGFVATLVSFIYAVKGQVIGMKVEIKAIRQELTKMSDVLITLGRQDERLTAMDRRIDDLQHGRGFVLEVPNKVTRAGPIT